MNENEISNKIIGFCIKIHSQLGPGLLESVYEEVLCYELKNSNLNFERQTEIPVIYEGNNVGIGFRSDVIVEKKLILELKSVEILSAVHYKQLLTYLKLTGIKLGLLINFNEVLIKEGIHRVVNKL